MGSKADGVAELASHAFDAHRASASKCHSSTNAKAEVCSWYRGQFAVMVSARSAHRSEWAAFINEVRKLERKRK